MSFHMTASADRGDRRFVLWCAVLFWGFAAQLPIGYTAAFLYDSPIWAWHRTRMAGSLLGTADMPAAAAPLVAQLSAMLGATVACWGVAMMFVIRGPFARREPWAWWCVFASLMAWTVVDTGLSVAHGVTINVLFNLVATAGIGLPLAMTWSRVARRPV